MYTGELYGDYAITLRQTYKERKKIIDTFRKICLSQGRGASWWHLQFFFRHTNDDNDHNDKHYLTTSTY